MQKRLIALAFILGFLMVSLLSFPVAASAAPHAACIHQVVTMNGSQPSQRACLDTGQIRPWAIDPACDASMLEIIAHSGATICFTGTGAINLRDFAFPTGGTWNNQASEALTGQWRVVFASGNNLAGKRVPAGKGTHLFFAQTPIGDEQLSSFNILSLG